MSAEVRAPKGVRRDKAAEEQLVIRLWNLLAAQAGTPVPTSELLAELNISRKQLDSFVSSLCALSDSVSGARMNLAVTENSLCLSGSAGEMDIDPLSADARSLMTQLSFQPDAPSSPSIGSDAYFGPFFHLLVESIQDGVRAGISYRAAHEQCPSKRLVDPHALIYEAGVIYLIAWDISKDSQRRYRVDRISEVTLTDDSVEAHDFLAATVDESLSSSCHLAIVGMPDRFYFDQLKWVGAQPLKERSSSDGILRVAVSYDTEAWLFDQVLSAAGEVVILEPSSLVDSFLSFAESLLG